MSARMLHSFRSRIVISCRTLAGHWLTVACKLLSRVRGLPGAVKHLPHNSGAIHNLIVGLELNPLRPIISEMLITPSCGRGYSSSSRHVQTASPSKHRKRGAVFSFSSPVMRYRYVTCNSWRNDQGLHGQGDSGAARVYVSARGYAVSGSKRGARWHVGGASSLLEGRCGVVREIVSWRLRRGVRSPEVQPADFSEDGGAGSSLRLHLHREGHRATALARGFSGRASRAGGVLVVCLLGLLAVSSPTSAASSPPSVLGNVLEAQVDSGDGFAPAALRWSGDDMWWVGSGWQVFYDGAAWCGFRQLDSASFTSSVGPVGAEFGDTSGRIRVLGSRSEMNDPDEWSRAWYWICGGMIGGGLTRFFAVLFGGFVRVFRPLSRW